RFRNSRRVAHAPLQQNRAAGERLPYNFFCATHSARNLRVLGATLSSPCSPSNSLHKRRKLGGPSTSYPVGRSLTSIPISVARCVVWLRTRSVLQSISSNKCQCGLFIPIK